MTKKAAIALEWTFLRSL